MIIRSGHARQRRILDIGVQAVKAVPKLTEQEPNVIKIQTVGIANQVLEIAIERHDMPALPPVADDALIIC